jgi:Integrase core domain
VPDTPLTVDPAAPSAPIESLLAAVAVRPAAAQGMRAMTQRESEFPSALAAKLTGVALNPTARAYADEVLTKVITVAAEGQVTDGMVAAYLAKYATKSTEITGHVSARLHDDSVDPYADPDGSWCGGCRRASGTLVGLVDLEGLGGLPALSARTEADRYRRRLPSGPTTRPSWSFGCAVAESRSRRTVHRPKACRGPWRTLADVELGTAQWIEWYNARRLHSAIGHVPPNGYEAAYYASIDEPGPEG